MTKNICEVYGQHGYIRTNYSYSPYGEVTISGDVIQPIQWSSEINDEDPVNSSRIVFYGRDGDIAYQKHDTIIEEIDNETKVITFSATVSASLVDYGDVLMIGEGIAGGASTGAVIGGAIGTLAGGTVAGPGAAAGTIIGGVVGGIGGACYGSDVSVSLLLKAKLTCKCTESQ
ncbi:MAG: hypothetical protein UHH87_03190 [Akkermansia sp.]|nr:hypothetical protein [Akkermansia sp.]